MYEAALEMIATKQYRKGVTKHREMQSLKKAEPHFRAVAIADCTPASLEKLIHGLPFSDSEKDKTFLLLDQSLDRLCRLDLLDRNPLDKVTKPHVVRKKPAPYTKDQAHTLIRTILGDRYESLYFVLMTTGIRPGEAFALDWEKVDFERKAINVNVTLANYDGKPYVSPTTKTSSGERWIKLANVAWESLERHAADGNRVGFVWKSPRGRVIRDSNFIRRQWRPMLESVGLPYRNPYQLRHTFATLGILNGIPLRIMSAMMGHASPEITLKAYSHVFDDSQLDHIHKIDAIFDVKAEPNVSGNVSDQSEKPTKKRRKPNQ